MLQFLFRVWGLAKPYKWRLALGVACGVLSGVADPAMLFTVLVVLKLIFPGSTGVGSDKAFAQLDRILEQAPWLKHAFESLQAWAAQIGHSGWFIVAVAAIIPAVMLVRGVAFYLNSYMMNWVAVRSITDLRAHAFQHLLNQPLSFFSKMNTGELMSRVNDIGVLQNVLGSSLTVIVKEPFSLISFATFLVVYYTKLTLVTLVVAPIFIAPVAIYSRKIRKSGVAIQTHVAGLARMMIESFSGNRIIKAYNLEDFVTQKFRGEMQKFISHYMRVVRSQETPGPLVEFLGSIGVAVLLIWFALQPSASISNFATFVVTIFLMYKPLKAIIRMHTQVEQARAATERIFQLLATANPMPEPENPKPLNAHNADIQFDNIDFDYGDRPVLRKVQLTVKAGQVIGIAGGSGSGKTTMANLLLRFYDPLKGQVRINGTDIREVSIRELRKQVAFVTQDTFLFHDTIKNNIALGRPGATDQEIIAAAKHAYAHDFIMEKPLGYDTVVGDRGMALSGGQRQRLAIARAILRDAPILVLDEATSSLDTESERAVQAALEELMKGRTTICIAHRLSTIQNADLIIVLDQGQIVETGKHNELLAKGGIYHKLYCLQFQGKSEAEN